MDIDESIIAAFTAAGEPLGRASLRDRLRVRNERLGHALARLADRGAIARIGERWGIPISTPSSARERNAAA